MTLTFEHDLVSVMLYHLV